MNKYLIALRNTKGDIIIYEKPLLIESINKEKAKEDYYKIKKYNKFEYVPEFICNEEGYSILDENIVLSLLKLKKYVSSSSQLKNYLVITIRKKLHGKVVYKNPKIVKAASYYEAKILYDSELFLRQSTTMTSEVICFLDGTITIDNKILIGLLNLK